MTPELEKVQKVMLRYAELVAKEYGQKWLPKNEHIAGTLELFKSPLPGFESFTPEELCARLELFFKTREPWLVSCRHNYSVFLKHVHRFIPPRLAPPDPRVAEVRADVCNDHPEIELKPGEICPQCFPLCTRCNKRHATAQSCEDAEKFEAIARRIAGQSPKNSGQAGSLRGGDIKSIHPVR